MINDLSRRSALKLLSANIALIAAGCSKPPEEVLPYVHMPERMLPGEPLQFASTLPLGGFGRGVICTSYDGRPIKVSGNPLHPASLGSTDLFAEAQVLSLYDPDRSQVSRHDGEITAFINLQTALAGRFDALKAGAGFRLLTEPLTSPTLLRQIEGLRRLYPGFRWSVHDPLEDTAARDGCRMAFGRELDARPRWPDISVVLSLDADFLGPGPSQIGIARGWAEARRVRSGTTDMARLYCFEAAPTQTGAKADHRWTATHQELDAIAAALARALGADLPQPRLPPALSHQIAVIAADLQTAKGKAAVFVGPGQPAETHALVHWINARLSAPIAFVEPVAKRGDGGIAELVSDLESGSVDTLVVAGCNPGYDAPGDSRIRKAIGRAKLSLHHGLYVDETARLCGWHLPDSHPLESWGDLRGPDGTASLVQPLIRPLYDTRSAVGLLEMLAGRFDGADYDVVRTTWSQSRGSEFDDFWRRALHDGVVTDSVAATIEAEEPKLPASLPTAPSGTVLRLRPDPTIFDGRFSNNAWLQECPKPLTKEVWGHSLGISPDDAKRLGVATGGGVKLSSGDHSIVTVARIEPLQANGTLDLTLGYGRSEAGLIGSGLGANAFALRSADALWAIGNITLAKADHAPLRLSTQEQFTIDGDRDDIFPSYRLGDVDRLRQTTPSTPAPNFYPPHDYAQADARWGMVIDASSCIGCNACVLACQVENNVPVVGPEEIARNRDMHWLRIDAYALEGGDGRTGFQPVPCMHCETAPCEPVCPVGASIHDSEGLNVQVYNRCIGTRFCEANCPYKVRRFNFFGYADGQEYGNLGAEIMHAHNNPNVSVRARGVMEKCTFCVQRISGARREAEKEGRPLRDGDVTTACQNACPTEAIRFGDLADRNADVTRLHGEPQHFTLLGSLNTKPRTTYLADIRNPNPELPEHQG